MLRRLLAFACVCPLVLSLPACTARPYVGFVRTVWAPAEQVTYNRFRVNSPDTATGRFKDRPEAKASGVMTIDLGGDLAEVRSASLYLELWGGHPGVANKRFTLNDQTEYLLPEVGAAEHNCTYSYPDIPLKLSQLRPGANEFTFTCDKGETFWGHYLIRAAAVRMDVEQDHPLVIQVGLSEFNAAVQLVPVDGAEAVQAMLTVDEAFADKIASVEYWGYYDGYDENGDGDTLDWHGYTKDRKPVAIVGLADEAPFAATWDTSMLPDQRALAVRAVVHFADTPELTYQTAAAETPMPDRLGSVTMYSVREMPTPFWSRADRAKTAQIDLPVDPATIDKAQLHVLIWDGGSGGLQRHFTLNGEALPVAGEGKHGVLYRILDIDPAILRRGANEIVVTSSTKHHGIEVILPGPALLVRTAGE